jgi:hypothetical protein
LTTELLPDSRHTNSSRPRAINFWQEPDTMVAAFQECQADPHCHIFYHHAYKTGGTSLEKAMYQVFGEHSRKSCCNQAMVEDFAQRGEQLCRRKFVSWQVDSRTFFRFVRTCARQYLQHPKLRLLLLTTFREPIPMTVSHIHQICNKNADRRSARVVAACTRCSYDEYRDVWDGYAEEINRQMEAVREVAHLQTNCSLPWEQTSVFTMEAGDLSVFLQAWLPDQTFTPYNPENKNVCDFAMPSTMMKSLRPATAIYRQLVTGS